MHTHYYADIAADLTHGEFFVDGLKKENLHYIAGLDRKQFSKRDKDGKKRKFNLISHMRKLDVDQKNYWKRQ